MKPEYKRFQKFLSPGGVEQVEREVRKWVETGMQKSVGSYEAGDVCGHMGGSYWRKYVLPNEGETVTFCDICPSCQDGHSRFPKHPSRASQREMEAYKDQLRLWLTHRLLYQKAEKEGRTLQ